MGIEISALLCYNLSRGNTMEKTTNEVLNEIQGYIKGSNHRRPCTLSTIKRSLRTKEVVDLIFSRPDVFNLSAEIKHVPEELLTDELLMRFVLNNAKNFYELDEQHQTLPVMLAFEMSKRLYERGSCVVWGRWGERLPYPQNLIECKKFLVETCNEIESAVEKRYDIEEIIKEINNVANQEIKTEENQFASEGVREKITIPNGKKLIILISGMPDSGKTTFSSMLADRFNNSVWFDSDMLVSNNLLEQKLDVLVGKDADVVVFSDVDADKFFSEKELAGYQTLNVVIEPESYRTAQVNSKYAHFRAMSTDDYEQTMKKKFNYDRISDALKVKNDYSQSLFDEREKVVDAALQTLSKSNNEEQLSQE